MSRLALLTAGVLVVLVGAFPAAASAARSTAPHSAFAVTPAKGGKGGGPGHGGGGGPTPSQICGSSTSISNCGFDVSYPQCPASSLPSPSSAYPAAFAIVGVNGGLANDYNSCLGGELSWASLFPGLTFPSSSQPAVSLYVNTADPGNMYNGQPIADWPTSGGGGGYGSCTTTKVRSRGHTYTVGANSNACAWQYGYNMVYGLDSSVYDPSITLLTLPGDVSQVASAANYPWWLDVETGNSWQTNTAMNLADLEGMVAAFQAAGVTTPGVYSTSSQWSSIIGTSLTTNSSLYGAPTWIPGATSYTGAQTNCSLPSFTGGTTGPTLTQWTGTLDSDYFCPASSA